MFSIRFIFILLLGLPLVAKGQTSPRVLFLLGDGFNCDEFWPPYAGLRAAGYRVDVASYKSNVEAGSRDRSLDFSGAISLDSVNPDLYLGLVLAGGHSPENLERFPKALSICQALNGTAKPIAAICHGPRLLAKAGLLKGRRISMYYGIKDELPLVWGTEAFGQHSDEALVTDGNLITSRYPKDTEIFHQGVLSFFKGRGGLAWKRKKTRILVPDDGMSKLQRYVYRSSTFGPFQVEVSGFSWKEDSRKNPSEQALPSVLVLPPGIGTDTLWRDPLFLKWFESRGAIPVFAGKEWIRKMPARLLKGRNVIVLSGDPVEDVGRVIQSLPKEPELDLPTVFPSGDAVLALNTGFDEEVYFALRHYLLARGKKVLVLGSGSGSVRSLNGIRVQPDARYSDSLRLKSGSLVVAPGCLWPVDSRGSDSLRISWILNRWQRGDTIVSFGFDNLWLCNREAFAGKQVASSDQTRWDFSKTAARYTDAPAIWTDSRFLSAKGASTISHAIRLWEGKK